MLNTMDQVIVVLWGLMVLRGYVKGFLGTAGGLLSLALALWGGGQLAQPVRQLLNQLLNLEVNLQVQLNQSLPLDEIVPAFEGGHQETLMEGLPPWWQQQVAAYLAENPIGDSAHTFTAALAGSFAQIIAYVAAMIVIYLAVRIVVGLLSGGLKRTHLGIFDRLLGAAVHGLAAVLAMSLLLNLLRIPAVMGPSQIGNLIDTSLLVPYLDLAAGLLPGLWQNLSI